MIAFHPLADIFPLMEGAEFDALVADIRSRGLVERIVVHEGMILDGRNRYRALTKLGVAAAEIRERFAVEHKPTCEHAIADPIGFVISKNIHRRHLTAEQKGEIIAKLLKAAPEKSDRQIAKAVKASPTYVGKVRSGLEKSGEVSTVDTRTDAKGVKQPAKKKRGKPLPLPVRAPEQRAEAQREFEAAMAEEAAQQHDRLRERVHELERENLALRSENEELRRQIEAFKSRAGDGLDIPKAPQRVG